MGIFNLFKTQRNREKLSHLKNLVALSLADGKIQEPELVAIAAICSREGLTEDDLEKCLKAPESINFVPPTDEKTKIKYLKDMVMLMMVDGNIDDTEMLTCKLTAEALGFRHEIVDAMIINIIKDIKHEMNL